MMGRKNGTIIFTDSKGLFDSIMKLGFPCEYCMLINAAAIKESYTTGEFTNVGHVLSRHNLTDCFTEEKADITLLCKIMRTGYLEHSIHQSLIDPNSLKQNEFKTNKRKENENP